MGFGHPQGSSSRWRGGAAARRAGICEGSIGRNDENSDAPAAEKMLPKLLDVPISTYLSVLAKIRLPSVTPSASPSRSL
jgi:hypothetical protein